MFHKTTLAALLTLTLVPACDEAKDPEPNDEMAAASEGESESEGEDEGEIEDASGDETSSGDAEPPVDEGGGVDSVTPLVLAFRGEAVQFNTAVVAEFDLTGTMSVRTDWPTSTTPWLALDRNGNGRIDDGGELFGSATLLVSGETASDGFAALGELDSNADGRIDPSDESWPRLLVWSDVNSDRVSAANELSSVAVRDLVAIDLDHVVDRRCDTRGNCEVERGGFLYRDGRGRELHGAVIDVHLRLR
ncbi:MAG: calcium-binding protein [Nannocystis sp.]|nr:hypothetical protein [Nannocystis sp.]MBA3548476.1 calcium-binding protein [Nannocystis sp.]